MNVLIFLYCLNPAGGVEQYITCLLPSLKKLGVNITLCVELPPDKDNQYYRDLLSKEITVHYPRFGPFPVYSWRWIIDIILLLLLPLTIVIIAGDVLFRKNKWKTSLKKIRGRLNNLTKPYLPEWIYQTPINLQLSWLKYRYKIDLLHVLRVDSINAIHWGLKSNLPMLYTEALEPGGDVYYPQLATAYSRLETVVSELPHIVTQSKRVKKSMITNWHVDPARINILPWVVEVLPNNEEQTISEKGGANIVFGYTGRLSPEKDIKTLLDAIKILHTTYANQFHLIIAGGGAATRELIAYTEELGLMTCVTFSGAYEKRDLPQILSLIDVFVISSLTEGAPLAVIEAMTHSKPVIATDVAGTGELVIDNVTGFLVQPRDPQALAAACQKFIADPTLVAKVGQKAKAHYQRCYTPQVGAKSLYRLYQKLCNSYHTH